jgi:predicted RND superfamily exporter protein
METVENVLGTVSLAEMVMDAEAQETGVQKVPDSQARIDDILEVLERTNPATLHAILPDRRHTTISIHWSSVKDRFK